MNQVVVIGVGNDFRRDDGLGPAVVQRLSTENLPAEVRVGYCVDGEPADLVTRWQEAMYAIVIDAIQVPGAHPGRIHRFTVTDGVIVVASATSSHGLGVGTAVELARALDRMPGTLVVYAVEGDDFSIGIGLSHAVEQAADEVAERILAELTEVCAAGGTKYPVYGSFSALTTGLTSERVLSHE